MVRKGDLVVIGICVGLALGFLIAFLLYFAIKWHTRRVRLRLAASENSVTTAPIRVNGLGTCAEISASLTSSFVHDEWDHSQTAHRFPWWTSNRKDPFVSSSGILQYSYKNIQKGTQNFTTMLGEGAFGPVYKVVMPSGEVVAAKVLASDSKQGEKEFRTEVALLGRLHHRNLVNLLGYCIEKGQRMLIYEFMSNGSLANFLYNEEDRILSWERRLQIALDIAHGIEYLHEGAVPPVVHRDLKSANILLDQSLQAKVADFGFSREEALDNRRHSGLKGTYGYIDPVYISTNRFTTKSDIYSFGIIMFELITAIHPHQNLMEYINLASMNPDGVDEIIDKRLVGDCDIEEVREFAAIAHKCLHMFQRKRPSISEVSQAILKIRQRNSLRLANMTSLSTDFSRNVSRIEEQQVELSKMASMQQIHE